MVSNWVATLQEKTGRSLDEWVRHIRKAGPSGNKERREWLKKEFGLGTNSAVWLADRAEGKGGELDSAEAYLRAAEGYVEEMFGGQKAALRPLYEALLSLGLSLGPDTKACPCQTIVPLYRNHVFAQIKPATRTRIEVGLALGARPASGRLISTGGYEKKDRITHRIAVSNLNEIDGELKRWLRTAYEEDQ